MESLKAILCETSFGVFVEQISLVIETGWLGSQVSGVDPTRDRALDAKCRARFSRSQVSISIRASIRGLGERRPNRLGATEVGKGCRGTKDRSRSDSSLLFVTRHPTSGAAAQGARVPDCLAGAGSWFIRPRSPSFRLPHILELIRPCRPHRMVPCRCPFAARALTVPEGAHQRKGRATI